MKPLAVLTRPEADSKRLASDLIHSGFRSMVLPLLRIDGLPAAQRLDLPPFRPGDVAVFVSANAVLHGLNPVRDAMVEGAQYCAVGRRTATALREFGLSADVPCREDSEGLLSLPALQQIADRRVVIVKGVGGRQILADQLRQAGAEVLEYECYQRQYIELTSAVVANKIAPRTPLVWVATSGGIVEHLGIGLAGSGHPELMSQPLLVPSVRVALQASTAGWSHVITAQDASNEAVAAALVRAFA